LLVESGRARLAVDYTPAGDFAVIALHGASDGTRDHFLLRHLHESLPTLGIGIATYDRRGEGESTGSPSVGKFEMQASDAEAVARTLGKLGVNRIGLWGYSQGAWVAPLVAERLPNVECAVLVSSAAVTPIRQMNFSVADQMHHAGYDEAAVDRAVGLRDRFAAWAAGADDASLNHDLAAASREPWWELVYLRSRLPGDRARRAWNKEMSLDPLPIFGRIRVPTLLFNGSCDEWIPVDESLVNWRSLGVPNLETVVIEGAAHDMTMPSGEISPIYDDSLKRWLAAHA